ncbi:type II secretion system F family protein [Limnohabitans sp. yimb22184]|jgi:tight adherence protein C|uniref:type II secretion system F family protein n=1 Tax=Limnohabitans sp. YIMB22184 TaxID=3374104 RepID=UPI003A8C4143
MTLTPLVFAALIFALVVSISYAVLVRWLPDPGKERLAQLKPSLASGRPSPWHSLQERLVAWLLWLSPWTAAMSGGDDETPSALRVRFWHAGWRSPAALQIYFTCKTLLTLVLPVIAWALVEISPWHPQGLPRFVPLLLGAATGYYLPDWVLNMQVRRRQRALLHAFPDALDLLRVCVQAGLGLDAAMERVGREIRQARPELSEEFALTGMALRAGSSRADALRHLSVRIGLKDIDALVSMLIQADRFGTSVSESLQVHSDALRTQRRLRAEEAAAKLPVKLLIPLIFCVFPSLLTVLLGPVVVTLARQLIKPVG